MPELFRYTVIGFDRNKDISKASSEDFQNKQMPMREGSFLDTHQTTRIELRKEESDTLCIIFQK